MASINNAIVSSKLDYCFGLNAGHPFDALFGTSHRLLDVASAACDQSSFGIRNLEAMVASGHLASPPLPFRLVGMDNTPPLRQGAGTARMGTSDSPPLLVVEENPTRAAALGVVPLHTVPPMMQVEVQTSTSIRQKAEMTLAMRRCMFSTDARALVFGTSLFDIL